MVGVVYDDPLQVFGDSRLADALRERIAVPGLQISMLEPRIHRRAVGIGANGLDFRVLFLEEHAEARGLLRPGATIGGLLLEKNFLPRGRKSAQMISSC